MTDSTDSRSTSGDSDSVNNSSKAPSKDEEGLDGNAGKSKTKKQKNICDFCEIKRKRGRPKKAKRSEQAPKLGRPAGSQPKADLLRPQPIANQEKDGPPPMAKKRRINWAVGSRVLQCALPC